MAGLARLTILRIENDADRYPYTLTRRAIAQALGFTEEDLWPPLGKRSPNFQLREWARVVYPDHASRRNGKGAS